MINRAIVSGNLTRDAESRVSQSGTLVLTFSVAVNERRKDASGTWTDYPNYIDCVMMGKRAEAIKDRMTKGAHVVVDGQLRQSRWKTRDGESRSKLEILVNEIEPPAKPKQPSQATQSVPSAPVTFEEVPRSVYDEDIPF